MRLMRALVIAPLLAAAACGTSDHHQGDDEESYNCEAETRDDDFVVGISKTGTSGVTFQLMTAAPAPPSRGDNTWLLQLQTGAGPMTDAAVTVTPFMPDHQHGTPIVVGVEPMPTAGQYNLTPINMWMPGLWEVTIEAAAQSTTDAVVFRFCIPS